MKKILCTVCVISIFSTTNIIFAQDQHVIVQPQKTPPANNKTKSKEDEMQALQQTGKRLPPGLSVTKMIAKEYAKSGNLSIYKFEVTPALNKATKEEIALKESQKAGYGNPNDLPSIPGYNNQKKAGGNGYQQLQLTPNEKFQDDGRYQPLMPLPKESTYDVVQPVQNNNSSSNLSPNNQSSLKGNTQTLKNNQYDNAHSPLNQYEVVPPLQGGQYNALPKEASDAHNNNPQFGKVPPPQDQQYTKLPPLQKEYNTLPNEALNVHNNNPQFGKVPPPPQDQQYTKLPPLQKEYNALPNEALIAHNNNPQFGKVPPPQDQQYTKLPPPQDQQYTKLPPPQDQQYTKLPPPPGEQPNNNGYTLAPAKNNEYGPVPALKEEAINNEKSGYTRAPAAPANKNINNSKSVNGALPQDNTAEGTPARILAEKKDKNELEKVELVKVEKTEQEILKAKLEEEKRVLEEKKKKEEEDKRALEEKKKKEEEEAAAKKKREEEEQKKLQNQHKPKPES